MSRDIMAKLREDSPLNFIPLESPKKIAWKDPRDGQEFTGYLVDTKALTNDELHAVYADMRKRFPDVPEFDAWAEIIRNSGMPIREERVLLIATDIRMVV